MAYEAEGRIYNLADTEQVSQSFQKRRLVLEMKDGSFTQLVEFEFTQDKCSLLDQYKVADEVRVFFNIRGREWTSPQNVKKYYNTLQAWRIEPLSGQQSPPQRAAAPMEDEPPPYIGDDDLPF